MILGVRSFISYQNILFLPGYKSQRVKSPSCHSLGGAEAVVCGPIDSGFTHSHPLNFEGISFPTGDSNHDGLVDRAAPQTAVYTPLGPVASCKKILIPFLPDIPGNPLPLPP